jgi:anaerobic magnesium-protoporphyrin IX monomethyl ester cyclase
MTDFRILFIYPNQRSESIVPPCIAIFSRLLKLRGFTVDLFDTSQYDIDADDYDDSSRNPGSERVGVQNLLAKPYEGFADAHRKHRNAVSDLDSKVNDFEPHLIAVTCTESTFLLATHLLRSISQYEILNIVGGVFCTFAPQQAISYPEIDMICVGEGENAIVDLCERMRAGKDYTNVTNLWIKKKSRHSRIEPEIICNPVSRAVDINEIPVGDFELFDDSRFYRPMYGKMYRMMPVETHRGCPYTCAFCNSPSQNQLYKNETNSKFFRKRSMTKVREELLYFRNTLKAEYIFFWADTFFAWNDREFDEFCEIYQDIKLPFWCQTRTETVNSKKISKLAKVGLHMITFGMEHGNESFRRDALLRDYTNASAIKALEIPHQHGVPYTVNNIIGFPGETRELAIDTVELNRQFDADQMGCSIFQPYQGTALRSLAVREGYIGKDTICPANSDDTKLNMPFFTSEEMRGLKRTFALYVKFPKSRWSEIAEAEKLTPEGDAKWEKLANEYTSTQFNFPETDIRETGNTRPIEIS